MAKEEGICFGCGKETAGVPAKQGWVIATARRFRSLFLLPARKTVACSACLPALLEKRKRFERHFFWYRAGGTLFFIVVLGAAAANGTLGAGALFGAAVGAIVIAGFSIFSYCPDFEKNL